MKKMPRTPATWTKSRMRGTTLAELPVHSIFCCRLISIHRIAALFIWNISVCSVQTCHDKVAELFSLRAFFGQQFHVLCPGRTPDRTLYTPHGVVALAFSSWLILALGSHFQC